MCDLALTCGKTEAKIPSRGSCERTFGFRSDLAMDGSTEKVNIASTVIAEILRRRFRVTSPP